MAAGHLGTIWASVALDLAPLGAGAARARRSMYALDATMSSRAKAMSGALMGIAKAGTMVALVIGAAGVKMAIDFDSSMRKVWSLTDESEAKFNQWSETVLEMSAELPASATKIGDAMYWVKSAMPDASDAQIFETLEWAAKGATGAIADEADAAKALTGAMNAYQEQDPAKYMDIMTKSVERGAITLQDFVGNMGKVIGTAADAGVGFEEVGAAVATLTKAGIPAETAFMSLNRVMMAYYKPSEQAKKAGAELGIEFSRSRLGALGLSGAMLEVMDKMEGNEDAIADLFPNIRALKAVFPLTGKAAEMFAADLEAVGNASGTTDRMFGRNMESMENKFKVMWGRVQNGLIELGTKAFPFLEKAINAVTNIIAGKNETFNALANAFKDIGTAIFIVGKAIVKVKPLLVGLAAAFAAIKIAKMVTGMETFSAALFKLTAARGIGTLATGTAATGAATTTAGKGWLALAASGGTLGKVLTGIGAGMTGLVATAGLAATAIGVGAVYGMIRADREAESLQKHLRALDKELGQAAADAMPLADEMGVLEIKMRGAKEGTAEYAEAKSNLVAKQHELLKTYPGLLRDITEEGELLLGTADSMKKYLSQRIAVAKLSGGTEELGYAATLDVLITKKEALMETTDNVVESLEDMRQMLKDSGVDGDNAIEIIDAYKRSIEDGDKALKILTGKDYDFISPGMWERMSTDWNKAKDVIKDVEEVTSLSVNELILEYLELDEAIMASLGNMNTAAAEAGTSAAALPAAVASALFSGRPIIAQEGKNALAGYINEFMRNSWTKTPEALGTFSSQIANLLGSGQFTAAWELAGANGANEMMLGITKELITNVLPNIDAETGKIPPIIAQALTSGKPEIETAAIASMQPWINALGNTVGESEEQANHIVSTINHALLTDEFKSTGNDDADKFLSGLADSMGKTDLLDESLKTSLAGTKKIAEDEGQTGGDAWLNSLTGNISGGKGQVQSAVNTATDVKIPDKEMKITPYLEPSTLKLRVEKEFADNPVFSSAKASARWVTNTFQSEFDKNPLSLSVSKNYAGGGAGLALPDPGRLGQFSDEVTALNAAFVEISSVGLPQWSDSIKNVPFGEAEQGLTSFLRTNGMAEEEIARQLGLWRNMRTAYDNASAELARVTKEMDTYNGKIRDAERQQEMLNRKVEEYNWQLKLSQERMTDAQDALSKWSGMGIKGETAADEKSFKLQQKMNKLQLGILKAEQAYDYEKAAQLQLKKDEIEKQKELHDLQTQITYDPQRKELEKVLDEQYGQEKSLARIVAGIKAAQAGIKTETDIQKKLNDSIAVAENKIRNITLQTQQWRDRVWELKVEFDNACGHVQHFEEIVNQMHRHFMEQFEEMRRAAEEAGRAAAAAAGGGGGGGSGSYQHGGPVMKTGMAFLHSGEFVLSKAMLQEMRRAPRAPSINVGGGDITVNVPLYLDGKQIAFATTRVTGQNASSYHRSGGKY